MGGALIEITVDDREMKALFRRLSARVSDMTPVMSVIGETLKASIGRNFEAGGRPGWQPLSPVTIKRKKNKGRVLIESGTLWDSINSRPSSHSVFVGTNKKYAAIHQFGGQAGRGGKVRRVPHRRGDEPRSGNTVRVRTSTSVGGTSARCLKGCALLARSEG